MVTNRHPAQGTRLTLLRYPLEFEQQERGLFHRLYLLFCLSLCDHFLVIFDIYIRKLFHWASAFLLLL